MAPECWRLFCPSWNFSGGPMMIGHVYDLIRTGGTDTLLGDMRFEGGSQCW
jgi:hypothetical protein